MKWTTEKPTQDGWYWMRGGEHDFNDVVRVNSEYLPPGTHSVAHIGSEVDYKLDGPRYEGAQWFGPLQPPSEAGDTDLPEPDGSAEIDVGPAEGVPGGRVLEAVDAWSEPLVRAAIGDAVEAERERCAAIADSLQSAEEEGWAAAASYIEGEIRRGA